MVHVISLDLLIYPVLLVVFMHIVQKLVALSEFVYHELLELHNIDNIEQGLHLVEHHDAQLVRYAAVAEFSHHNEERFHNLSSDRHWDEKGQFYVLMRRFWHICSHDYVLS